MAEFVEGYEFISKFSKTVTILGSARTKPTQKWYKEAVVLGKMLGKGGYTTLTGAGPGIMEAANKGAKLGKGKSIGINIELPFEQVLNPYVDHAEGFNYFFTRKVMLLSPAQAFVFFPGGYGTMDEFFEVFDLMETGFLSSAPIICVGKDFWNPVMDFLVSRSVREGILDQKMFDRVFVVDSAKAAYDIVKTSKDLPPSICKLSPENFQCEEQINWRVFKIMAELVEGFDMVTKFLDDVTILGSKALAEESEYYHQAYRLGLMLGKKKYTVVTGGGPGITEAANKGAAQANAMSVGLVLRQGAKDLANEYINAHASFEFPFTRKLILTAPSNAFVVFPGGLGTLHQAFELLTLIQTRKSHKVPVIFYDSAYWKPMLDFIKKKLLNEYKTISKGDEKFYTVVDTVEDIVKMIEKQPREGSRKARRR